jgi:hypothetical protein
LIYSCQDPGNTTFFRIFNPTYVSEPDRVSANRPRRDYFSYSARPMRPQYRIPAEKGSLTVGLDANRVLVG